MPVRRAVAGYRVQPIFKRLDLTLSADPARVVVRPFHLSWQANGSQPSRARRLVDDILQLSESQVQASLHAVLHDFEQRHWQTQRVFNTRFEDLDREIGLDIGPVSEARRLLIGAYFCHEYSYAAAALMNPSVVPHPDQSGLDDDTMRFVMSLRAVGEGHISSVAFREGLIGTDGSLYLMRQPPFATAAEIVASDTPLADGAVMVGRHPDSTLSGMVMFPVTPEQANGLEDLRLTAFDHDDGSREYIGTYTAFSGRSIRSEMLRTRDFRSFLLEPLSGPATVNKGLALFPRTIDGQYAMIGRQDGKNLFLIRSDRLDHWGEGELIAEPAFPWEFVQIGNCGPPIEIDEGWLLLTHGVGAMRKYSIGAALLDKKDPSKVIGRTREPVITAVSHEREGYVPNVVYTCGGMRLGSRLFIPYGLADSAVGFAMIDVPELLRLM